MQVRKPRGKLASPRYGRHSPVIGIVTEGVRADALGPEGRGLATGLSRVAFHQGVNAKASQSLSPVIEEERFPAEALTDQLFECGGGPGPKRTAARFSFIESF